MGDDVLSAGLPGWKGRGKSARGAIESEGAGQALSDTSGLRQRRRRQLMVVMASCFGNKV